MASNDPRAPRLLPYTHPNLKVNTLINPTTNQWDMEVIRDLIEHDDISFIQKLYLPEQLAQDGIIWPYRSDGNYTVKSGYHSIDMKIVPPPLASFPDLTKQIWSSTLPPKLQHFFWKMGSGIIAVKENLLHRHIPVDPTCPRCFNNNESSVHAFFTCPFAQQVWRLSGLSILTDENNLFIKS